MTHQPIVPDIGWTPRQIAHILDVSGDGHWWDLDGMCRGCGCHWDWETLRASDCPNRFKYEKFPATKDARPPLESHPETLRRRLEEVEHALAKIADGTYLHTDRRWAAWLASEERDRGGKKKSR